MKIYDNVCINVIIDREMVMSSMKDVARLAGVSISTVSRVINKTIPVDEETRKRVEEAVRNLNYKPNLLAKGLRLKSGNLIGLVVPEFVHSQAFSEFINYTEEFAVKYGFNLILGNNHNNPDIEERFIDSLIRRNVDGIIFSRVSDESRVLRIIDKTNIPIVVIDRALDNEDVPSVVLDNYKAGVIAAEHLVKIGHKNIACITGPLNISLCRERLKGFKDVLSKNGISLKREFIFEGDFKYDSGIEAMKYFLENNYKITAIWAQNDLMAIGALNTLKHYGIKIPEEMSLIGMDNINLTEMVVPSITTIMQPYKEMCEKAVELIIKQEKKVEIFNKKVIVKPSIIIRETTVKIR